MPSPPSSVVGMVSVKAPLASSMRTASSPARASTAILRDALAPDAEVGRAVVADVDLENVGPAGLEAKGDLVARAGARDRQRAVLELRRLEACLPVGRVPSRTARRPPARPRSRRPRCDGGQATASRQPCRPSWRVVVRCDSSWVHVSSRVSEWLVGAKDAVRRRLIPGSMLTRRTGRRRPPSPMERPLDPARLGDHLDRLYRAAWALCGSREDAEDLVQETYARVLARPRLLRNEDDLGYLLRALRNTFLTQKRTEGRRLRPGPLPDQLDLVADPQRAPAAGRARGRRALRRDRRASRTTSATSSSPSTSPASRTRRRPSALRIREGTVMSRLYRARQQVVRRVDGDRHGRRAARISRRVPSRRAPSRRTRPDRRRPARA